MLKNKKHANSVFNFHDNIMAYDDAENLLSIPSPFFFFFDFPHFTFFHWFYSKSACVSFLVGFLWTPEDSLLNFFLQGRNDDFWFCHDSQCWRQMMMTNVPANDDRNSGLNLLLWGVSFSLKPLYRGIGSYFSPSNSDVKSNLMEKDVSLKQWWNLNLKTFIWSLSQGEYNESLLASWLGDFVFSQGCFSLSHRAFPLSHPRFPLSQRPFPLSQRRLLS